MKDVAAFTQEEVLRQLSLKGEARRELFQRADAVRREFTGEAVFIRGIIEFSNICANDCLYCGIRASNRNIGRYTLDAEEVLRVARKMYDCRQKTVVLQSGPRPPWATANSAN